MKIDKIFKQMKQVGLAFPEKRKPTSPSAKQIIKKIPEKQEFSKHRYGAEDRPPPLPGAKKTSSLQKRETLAFCPDCDCNQPMKWKPRKKRGKKVDEWFECAVCNCDRLEIKIIKK